MKTGRFTLQPDTWYTMEFHIANGGEYEYWESAVKVNSIQPRGSGGGIFDLSFYHADYPAGVRDKTYTLRTLLRTEAYVIAERLGETDRQMSVMLFNLQSEWLKQHYHIEAKSLSEAVQTLERIKSTSW